MNLLISWRNGQESLYGCRDEGDARQLLDKVATENSDMNADEFGLSYLSHAYTTDPNPKSFQWVDGKWIEDNK